MDQPLPPIVRAMSRLGKLDCDPGEAGIAPSVESPWANLLARFTGIAPLKSVTPARSRRGLRILHPLETKILQAHAVAASEDGYTPRRSYFDHEESNITWNCRR